MAMLRFRNNQLTIALNNNLNITNPLIFKAS